jgi:hypothetical protein
MAFAECKPVLSFVLRAEPSVFGYEDGSASGFVSANNMLVSSIAVPQDKNVSVGWCPKLALNVVSKNFQATLECVSPVMR